MKRSLFLLTLLLLPLAARAAPVCEQPALVCDGATNDTAALQAALDVGGHVILPAGTCIVTQLEIGSNTWLQGQGAGSTTLKRLSTATNLRGVIKNKNISGTPTDTNIRITDLSLDWPNVIPDNGMFNNGVYIERAADVHVERLRGTQHATVGGESGYNSKGIQLRAVNRGWIIDNELTDIADNAFNCGYSETWADYTGTCIVRGNRYTQTTARIHSAFIVEATDAVVTENFATFPDPRHCCTDAGGTSCKIPNQVCTTDASCTASTPYVICVESTQSGVEAGASDPRQTFATNTIINGILGLGQAHGVVIANNTLSGRGAGISLQDGFGPLHDVTVIGNDAPFVNLRAYPHCCTSAAGTSCRTPRFDCAADADCAGVAPYQTCAQEFDRVQIVGNRLHGNSGAYGYGLLYNTRAGSSLVARDNEIHDNQKAGVWILDSTAILEGNHIFANGTGGCTEPRDCAGVYIQSPRGGRFFNNCIERNETAMWLESPPSVPIDVVDDGRIVDNTFQPVRHNGSGAAPIRLFRGVGLGSPEAVQFGSVGSTWTRTDVGAGGNLYIKQTGAGNTGWILK